MDSREVLVIGTINALPYKLATYPDANLTMTILVVDIPPRYGMLLSRKWSATMGGRLQCDLYFSTFHVNNKAIKVTREPRVNHMVEEHIATEDVDETCFLNTYIDSFRAEFLVLQKKKVPTMLSQEVKCSQGDDL